MVRITSRDKVMFPDAGITKGELIDYYESVADAMLEHLAGRPLTLERFPSGIGKRGFMQKNSPDYFPDFIGRFSMDKKDGETLHPVIDSADGLIYLANQNTVTFHAPVFSAGNSESPDRLIFDLDPSPGRTETARHAARTIKEFLDLLELPGFLMTTGSKGYHVVTPLDATDSWTVTSEIAQGIARLAVAHDPDALTLEFQKKNRADRVFVDWLRNGFGATAVAPWSVRPRPNAPVAMPLEWDELDATAPDAWTIANAPDRLPVRPWVAYGESHANLSVAHPAVMKLLDTAGLELQNFDRFRS